MEKVLLGSFCGAGVVRASFLQGATKSVLGALVLLRQTNRNACPIGMRWVRPTNLNALREHRCRELSVVAPPGSGWRVASKKRLAWVPQDRSDRSGFSESRVRSVLRALAKRDITVPTGQ
jgi:hypothetical protein